MDKEVGNLDPNQHVHDETGYLTLPSLPQGQSSDPVFSVTYKEERTPTTIVVILFLRGLDRTDSIGSVPI